jgi:predicted methyltransferase
MRRLTRLCLLAALLAAACLRRGPPPGPNDAYRDPRMGAEAWRHFFEDPGRGEIYLARDRILALAAPKPGMAVVDVGAGTGLFSMMLAAAVGPGGRVYAEEVEAKFAGYVAARALAEGHDNVVSVMGTELGVGLPPASVDLAFLCDVYHHFDHPAEMLASIRRALRPGGELFLVDFRREPGKMSPALLQHVRADEATVAREIAAAGFVPISADHSLQDSYALRFRR